MSTQQSFVERHHLLLRRLHSLTGVLPIGAFLIMHLTTNSSIVWGMIDARKGATGVERGVKTFGHEVDFIHSIPFLLLIEVFGLWIPIAFHSLFGFYYAFTARPNTRLYPYADNWRYTLQRVSGYVGFFFVLYHVATARWGWTWLPGAATFSAEGAASTTARMLQGGTPGLDAVGVAVALFYMLGASLLVFHFANGLWTFAITWGLTISEQAQRRWGYACTAIGVGMMGMAWMAVIGFATLDVAEAERYEGIGGHAETAMLDQQPGAGAAPREPTAENEPGYPWPGTENVVAQEQREGPLQR